MNTTVIKKVPVHAPRLRKVWLTPQGHIATNVVPEKSQTDWEAYVLDAETGEVIEKFPRLSGHGEYVVSANVRPTTQITEDYFRQLEETLASDVFVELKELVAADIYQIATIIINTDKPA